MSVKQVLAQHFATHTGSWLRALLYCLIAFLGVWASAMGDKFGPELWAELAGRWPALLVASMLQVALTLRAYIDQHVSHEKADKLETQEALTATHDKQAATS
jgi:hypothetical protein